ncbi:MAG: serine/threonine-protein kinase [Mycobacterium sp.]
MPLADGATFAGYTIIRLLGAGGMGEVYLAAHPRLPRQDALKVLPASVTADREFRERFEREADMVAALWNPHIVGVHDRGEYDGQLWITMDYVEGTDAAELLRHQPQGLPPADVLTIVDAVSDALDYAHDRHLLHRDVKPANILVSQPESGARRILLADFGIARRDDDTSGLTATNMTVGTVSYAAPEQLMGADLDGRADQYALAATAFHLLTGAPPFAHSNPAVVISQHLSAAPPKVSLRKPELAHLDNALAKALSKDPADRFARCADFARALSHQVGLSAAGAFPGPVEETQLSPVQKQTHHWLRPAIVVPVVLAILLVAAVAFAIGQFTGDEDAQVAAPRPTTTTTTTAVTTPLPTTASPVAPPPPPPVTTDTVTETEVTETATTTATTTSTATTAAVVGGDCAEPGATGVTADGATTYCANLQYTDRYLWSLSPGEIANPVVTSSPLAPLPLETESPVRICMQQTGHSRLRCAAEILHGNEP